MSKTPLLAAVIAGSLLTSAGRDAAEHVPTGDHSADRISLAGTWRFELDRANTGVEERWFERALPQKIKLPGSLPAQGIGDDIIGRDQMDRRHRGQVLVHGAGVCAVSPAGEYQSALLAAAAKSITLARRGISATLRFRPIGRASGPC